jgi:outer membrane immunogenic protein
MRTRLLTTAAALVLSSAGVMAADLPARAPAVAPAPIFTQTAFSWTGFYVGLNAGAAFNDKNRCSGFRPVTAAGAPIAGFPGACGFGNNNDDATFTGGAQIGYNWQFGSLVAGVEADINLLNGNRSRSGTLIAAGVDPSIDGAYALSGGRGHGDYFGTARLRLGYAFDRALIYVTGGLAWGESGGRGDTAVFSQGGVASAVYTNGGRGGDRLGWALGAGLEYAIANNWTVKGEYMYADLGRRRGGGAYACTDIVAGTCAAQFGAGGAFPGGAFVGGGGRDNGIHVVRVGLNYLFNSSRSGGVVARY